MYWVLHFVGFVLYFSQKKKLKEKKEALYICPTCNLDKEPSWIFVNCLSGHTMTITPQRLLLGNLELTMLENLLSRLTYHFPGGATSDASHLLLNSLDCQTQKTNWPKSQESSLLRCNARKPDLSLPPYLLKACNMLTLCGFRQGLRCIEREEYDAAYK